VVFDNQDTHGGHRGAPPSGEAPVKGCLTAGYRRITAAVPLLSPAERYPWVESFPKTSKGVIEMEASKEKAPSAQAGRGRARLARPAVLALALAAALGLAVLASGCGGSPGAKVAQAGTTSGSSGSGSSGGSGKGDAAAYSACMRGHGVPNFPDPDSSGRIRIPSTIDDRSPTVRAAYRACHSLAPSGGFTGQGDTLQQDQLLAFAKCMRRHGVPAFPDPQVVNGHINIPITAGQIDPNSPIVTAAAAACQSKLGGRSPARGAAKLVGGAAGLTRGKGK
jgi:hypothetical protein